MFENSHPTDDQLEEYVAGDVPSDDFELIDQHVERCDECRERLDRVPTGEDVRPAIPLEHRTIPEIPEACRRMMQNAERLVHEGEAGGSAWDVDRTIDAEAATIDHVPISTRDLVRGGGYQPGDVFGDYEIIREIGRGGMGVVYLARQVSLNREVAIKMILDSRLVSEESIRRFRAEAESAARLAHPGIVPVYEVGEIDGQHFFSMGYVNGPSLRQVIDTEGPFDGRRAAKVVASVARTVQHAHTRNIVHRDLKPGNVLMDPVGGPKLTDFGLAKDFESGVDLTSDGQVLGTPHYMSPEQASGRTSEVGPLSDVYALGAILYHVVSNRPPFSEDSVLRTLNAVVNDEPVSPRKFNPGVDADLVTICLKCLEKDPARRYNSAGDVADELNRYLRDVPIEARSISVPERVGRWFRRNPRVVWGMVATLLVLVGTVFYAAYELDRVARILEAQLDETIQDDLQSTVGWMGAAMEGELSAKFRQTQIAADAISGDEELRKALLESPAVKEELSRWHEDAQAARSRGEPLPEYPEGLRALQHWVSDNRAWRDGVGSNEMPLGPNLWRYAAPEVSYNVTAWWVCGADGTQLARDPMEPVGKQDFAYRSYWTGSEKDADPGTHPEPEWKLGNAPRLSAPFLTEDTKKWVIAISVPVFAEDEGERRDGTGQDGDERASTDDDEDEDGTLLGVVGMFVEVGDLIQTDDTSDDSRRIPILLDPRHGDDAKFIDHPYFDDPAARVEENGRLVIREKVAATTMARSEWEAPLGVDSFAAKGFENTERFGGRWRTAHTKVALPGGEEHLIALVREPEEIIADPGRRLRTNLRSLGIAILGLFLIPPIVALFLATRRR